MKRYKFSEMWDLVKRYRPSSLPYAYSDELLIAIMWEESTFQNKREQRKNGPGPAVGFGQVNDTEFWRWPQYPKDLLTAWVLGYDWFSVQLTCWMLTDLHQRNSGNKSYTLHGYAGTASNPANQTALNHWLRCEELLKKPYRSVRLPQGYYVPVKGDIWAALKAAKPNGEGFLADVLSDISSTPT